MPRAMRILLAEDERTISRLISQVLTSLGHDVTGVQAAAEALALLQSETYDLILLDLNLADGDGMRVVEELARLPAASTPVVLMTGEHVFSEGDARASMVAGVLSKPFEIEELEQTVARFSA